MKQHKPQNIELSGGNQIPDLKEPPERYPAEGAGVLGYLHRLPWDEGSFNSLVSSLLCGHRSVVPQKPIHRKDPRNHSTAVAEATN